MTAAKRSSVFSASVNLLLCFEVLPSLYPGGAEEVIDYWADRGVRGMEGWKEKEIWRGEEGGRLGGAPRKSRRVGRLLRLIEAGGFSAIISYALSQFKFHVPFSSLLRTNKS